MLLSPWVYLSRKALTIGARCGYLLGTMVEFGGTQAPPEQERIYQEALAAHLNECYRDSAVKTLKIFLQRLSSHSSSESSFISAKEMKEISSAVSGSIASNTLLALLSRPLSTQRLLWHLQKFQQIFPRL